MRFAVVAAAAALVAGVSAQYGNGTTIYTTEVVTEYTTYCPAATSIVHGNQTYTVTEATTLTITNCPCTLTKPILTSTIVSCTACSSTPVPTSSAKAAPTYSNTTVSVAVPPTSAVSAGIPTTVSSSPIQSQSPGAANRAFVASGAVLGGLFGLAAYVL